MISLGIDIGGTCTKVAVIDETGTVWTATSPAYVRPVATELHAVLRNLLSQLPPTAAAADDLRTGLCAPGLYDPAAGVITAAVNMPGLVGVPLDQLVATSLPGDRRGGRQPLHVVSDVHAAAFDFVSVRGLSGRLLAISLGTGVGAAVLDDGKPLRVTGLSSGHFGQMDVTVPGIDPVPVGPDGGRGSLEGYLGIPALQARYGDPAAWLSQARGDEPEIAALVRALRIGHAIYRPEHIALLGGIGNRLARALPIIDRCVRHGLTSLARLDWSLRCGDHDHHAACGAARLAAGG
jgi:glucokinase